MGLILRSGSLGHRKLAKPKSSQAGFILMGLLVLIFVAGLVLAEAGAK